MSRELAFRLRNAGGVAAVVAGVVVASATLLAALAGAAEPCCFANDRYEGNCMVVPGEGESCQSILAYLNNPLSTGKSYCGSTSVRGGWVQVDCTTGKPLVQHGASGSAARALRGCEPMARERSGRRS
ncbi:MAG: hypothetical protein MUF10_03335 [Thermoanaerobaculaceae bacterium]|nr:hypothetical protein [Thermoanaerobaculaceae bacterium]